MPDRGASPVWAAIAAGGLSAVMLWASSPPVGVSSLAWVALVPTASMVRANPGTRAARLAMALTYALYLELLLVPALPLGLTYGQWGDPPIPVLLGGSPMLAVALLAIPLLGAALYAIHFGEPWLGAGAGSRVATLRCVLGPALAWMALDFARAKLDPGGLWGPLFVTQADEAGERPRRARRALADHRLDRRGQLRHRPGARERKGAPRRGPNSRRCHVGVHRIAGSPRGR